MATQFSPDLTGTLDDYKVINDIYVLFQTGQKIEFGDRVVFADTIAMTLVASTPLIFSRGVDWDINDDDIDVTAMSRAKTQDAAFNRVLLKSLTIIRPIASDLRVSLAYQTLYPLASRAGLLGNQVVEFTPDAWLDLVTRVGAMESQFRPVSDVQAVTNATPRLLEIDLTGTAVANRVVKEVHTLNTYEGLNVIRPVCGSFYRGSVVLSVPSRGITLEVDTHYTFFGLNKAKTLTSSDDAGVWDYIQVAYPYAGDVEVTYQAYGGVVTVDDLSTVYRIANGINRYLDGHTFLTPETVGLVPAFQTALSRINQLETRMRALLTGAPQYGDSTANGVARVYKLRAVDTALHWWTIARLFQVTGSTDVITADRACFRLKAVQSGLMADVTVAVDLHGRDVLTVDSAGVVQDVGFTVYGDVSPAMVVMPQFRVIYNSGTGSEAGCFLQIGLQLPSLVETLAIEDRSGIEGCWLFRDADTSARSPNDNLVTLPDGVTVWDVAGPESHQAVRMLPNKTGYLIWLGTTPLDTADLSQTALTLGDHRMPAGFRIEDVHTLQLELYDVATSVYHRVLVPMTGTSADARQGRTAVCVRATNDTTDTAGAEIATGLTATLGRNGTGALSVTVHLERNISTTLGQLQLRYVIGRV